MYLVEGPTTFSREGHLNILKNLYPSSLHANTYSCTASQHAPPRRLIGHHSACGCHLHHSIV
ncbi:hypothetical protein L207DRAFT_69328 [Hyaloscypha variabilis F]|uniref:Uncharacterized protein n=1 Tax=Hyaloscypha variabilis (strain UAMH 11265 / GT02V1 / F) TaxID=1149755 RepID=A0A2J6RIY5_HYAVF|nr:hypothetical protein L207DRAFT_69328 [Hyaloscypha variabilis F]